MIDGLNGIRQNASAGIAGAREAGAAKAAAREALPGNDKGLTVVDSEIGRYDWLNKGIEKVPDSALKRNDKLGNKINEAFDFEPPECPHFA